MVTRFYIFIFTIYLNRIIFGKLFVAKCFGNGINSKLWGVYSNIR